MDLRGLLSAVPFLMALGVIFIDRKRPAEMILWVVVLMFLPWWGVLIYLVFGNTLSLKLVSKVRRYRLDKHFRHLAGPEDKRGPRELEQALSALSPGNRRLAEFNRAIGGSPLTCYEEKRIFTDGQSHMESLYRDMESARSSIYAEFYSVQNDETGRAFVDALTRKAREGVYVVLLVDFCANVTCPPSMFRPLVKAGGHVKRVKPYMTHFRSHRKNVVIDMRVAYIGGMNIGDKYLGKSKRKSPWRDTQVRLTGPCVATLCSYFITDWACALSRREMEAVRGSAEKRIREELAGLPGPRPLRDDRLCQFVMGGAENDAESIKLAYLAMIRGAKKRIRIQSPYFIPDDEVLSALEAALAVGVRVELMLPGKKSSFFLEPVSRYYCAVLSQWGAKIYRYRGYIHAKTLMADDEICCVGSVNMDMRSLQVDDEICGVFYAPEMIGQYQAIFTDDLQKCGEWTKEQLQDRSVGQKLAERALLLFAPLF